ncbi:L-proline glycine betaine ABC transport system permease protein ProW [Paramixta manurensis]|uniref:L-proline glycine betaine ABC transport system permease protein ProW n=2 Tax=Paramixta manurensis TaxID=2740817 RepID=A0A6M8UIA2_9GAMM|nr:L-proline glycine betaine ABC transport system permease protein ProW [Erwiniaceae bacterium PD-1]
MDWQWIMDNRATIGALLLDHLQLVGLALLFGTLLTLLFILLTLRWPALSQPLLYLSGLLFTIPSLALFILLMPLTGLSKTTSVIGLTLYSLLILLRNVLTGLSQLPPLVLEAARAQGYTRLFRFFDVELPLVVPALLAGLRIASVTLVGLVTVTALIGQGGLGQLLLTGFTLSFATPIVVSLVLTVVISTVLDGLFVMLGRIAAPWSRT